MRVIVFGSKQFTDLIEFDKIVKASGLHITTIMTPLNIGVCEVGEQWCARKGLSIFPIDVRHFKQIRSLAGCCVYDLADAALLIHNKDCYYSNLIMTEMRKRGKRVYSVIVGNDLKRTQRNHRWASYRRIDDRNVKAGGKK
jgi:hypothetical protein